MTQSTPTTGSEAMGFRANTRLILLLVPLLWAITALLGFIALGFDVFSWSPSARALYLSWVWPIGLPILALFSTRITRLLLPGVDAVTLSEDVMILRTEPVRLRDRRIVREHVTDIRTTTIKHGELLHIRVASGKRRGLNLRLIQRPDELLAAIDSQWPELTVHRSAQTAPHGSTSK